MFPFQGDISFQAQISGHKTLSPAVFEFSSADRFEIPDQTALLDGQKGYENLYDYKK
jgi:hypothetical protein